MSTTASGVGSAGSCSEGHNCRAPRKKLVFRVRQADSVVMTPRQKFQVALRHTVAGALAVASVLLAGLAVEAHAYSQKDPGISVPSEFHMTFEQPPN